MGEFWNISLRFPPNLHQFRELHCVKSIMVIKFYISQISGNKEMKKRQLKAQLLLASKGVEFSVIDIADPGLEVERKYMQANAKVKDNARNPIPPQFFNEDIYCGDYEGFDEANELDCLEEFLKLPAGTLPRVAVLNNEPSSRDLSMEKEIAPAPAAQSNGIEHDLQETKVLQEETENKDLVRRRERRERRGRRGRRGRGGGGRR